MHKGKVGQPRKVRLRRSMLQTDSKTFFGHDKPYRRFGEGGPAWPIAAMAAMGCWGVRAASLTAGCGARAVSGGAGPLFRLRIRYAAMTCQRKVEMSGFLPSRNVRFQGFLQG